VNINTALLTDAFFYQSPNVLHHSSSLYTKTTAKHLEMTRTTGMSGSSFSSIAGRSSNGGTISTDRLLAID